jgi:putative transposase
MDGSDGESAWPLWLAGWRVHTWVLMGNYLQFLLETPEPNLPAGMEWVFSVFSQGWNRRRGR